MKLRILGFDVVIQPSFFVVAVLLGWPRGTGADALTQGVSWVLAVGVSVLVHELGHALATRAYGGTAHIELYALGGMTYPETAVPFSRKQDASISFAGPAAGFALGGLVYLVDASGVLGSSPPIVHTFVRHMLWVNVGWGALNLLPMLPLDGGHILRTALDGLTGGRGARPASLISIAFSVAAVALSLSIGWIWAALIAGFCGVNAYQQLRRVKEHDADAPVREALADLSKRWDALDDPARKHRLEALLQAAKSSALRARLATMLTWIWVGEGDAEGAKQASRHFGEGQLPEALDGALLALQGRTREAMPKLQATLEDAEESTSIRRWAAQQLLCAHVEQGESERAVELLRGLDGALRDRRLDAALTAALFHAGAFELSAEVGAETFERHGQADDAYNVACSYGRIAGREDEALRWLERAIDGGYDDVEQLDADDDLRPLRALPGYQAVRAKLPPEA